MKTGIRHNTRDEILADIRLNQLGFVFQSFNLLPNLTVIENVEIPMKIKGELSSSEIKSRAKELLESVGLSHRLDHFPNQISGGEQQRVTIARALSNKPSILLLDEPTGDLDTNNSDNVIEILLKLNLVDKITLIMVTHDINLKYFADRVVRVVDGKINNEYAIDLEKRFDAISKLYERIENPNSVGIREGGTSKGINNDFNDKENEVLDKESFIKIDDDNDKNIDRSINDIKTRIGNNGNSRTFVRKREDYAIKKIVSK